MLEQEVVDPEELNSDNLESFFEDPTFVDYFNTFLALPCFAERLFYNRELGLFEEFVQKLADDVDEGDVQAASQLRKFTHFKATTDNVTNNQTGIGYYVTTLDKRTSFKFVQEYRMPLFLRSELYAEYKLSIILSTVQASLLGNFPEDEEIESDRFGRRRSVNFKLSSNGDHQYSTRSQFSERNPDSPHIRSIEETFSAWQDSFRQADSRASLYSYTDTTSIPKTPEIKEPDSENSSTSSVFDSTELETDPNTRPQSRLSFMSDVSEVTVESIMGSQVGSVDTALEEVEIDENGHSASNRKDESTSSQNGYIKEGNYTNVLGSGEERSGIDKTEVETENTALKVDNQQNEELAGNDDQDSSAILSCKCVPRSSKETGRTPFVEANEPEDDSDHNKRETTLREEEEECSVKSDTKDETSSIPLILDDSEHLLEMELNQHSLAGEMTAIFKEGQYVMPRTGIAVETIIEEDEETQSEPSSDVISDYTLSLSKRSVDLEEVSASAESTMGYSDVQSDRYSEDEEAALHNSNFKSITNDICHKCGGTLKTLNDGKTNVSSKDDGDAGICCTFVNIKSIRDNRTLESLSGSEKEYLEVNEEEVSMKPETSDANAMTKVIREGTDLDTSQSTLKEECNLSSGGIIEKNPQDQVIEDVEQRPNEHGGSQLGDYMDTSQSSLINEHKTSQGTEDIESTSNEHGGSQLGDYTDTLQSSTINGHKTSQGTEDIESTSVEHGESQLGDYMDTPQSSTINEHKASQGTEDVESTAIEHGESQLGDYMDTPQSSTINENKTAQGTEDVESTPSGPEVQEEKEDVEGVETNSGFTLQGIRGILSARRRESTATTSIGYDVDSDFDEDEEDEDCKPCDLSTKDGMDEFKEFLLGTNAERHLKLWIDVECVKHSDEEQEKLAVTRVVRERYWSSGGLYELPSETKRRLELEDSSKVTYSRLLSIQHWVLEPVMAYWCPRFTMHQQRRRVRGLDVEYTRLANLRPKSCIRRENELSNLPQEPDTCGLTQITCTETRVTCTETQLTWRDHAIRPQSCRGTRGQESRAVTAKTTIRAKSAHSRLLPAHTPIHTNAGTEQLQNITASLRPGYGFSQIKPPTFNSDTLPDYHSTVRLYINPVPTPDGRVQKMLRLLHRTAVSADNPQPIRCAKQRSSVSGEDHMDALIEGLILERQTGGYFEAFLRRLGNKLWIDCLEFWKLLQDYNAYFFADSLNPLVMTKKAKSMYARFVVGGGMQALGLNNHIQELVAKQLDPPYEELFDAVEDHALRCLLDPWKLLKDNEDQNYAVITKEQKVRHLDLKFLPRRRQSYISSTNELDFLDDDVDKEKISIEEANRPIPVPKDGITFEALIKNRQEIEYFKEFLSKKHAKGIKDLMAWTDMETFRRIPRDMDEKRDKKANEVRNSWLTKKYFFGNDSPASRKGQNMIMNVNGGRVIKERPSSPVITESQKFVRARLERRWLLLFKQTADFLDRQKPRVTAPEVVEDILLKRRLQKSEMAWKILNSRWVSSSRDVVALRNTLLNADSCIEFKTYVALKGDTFENDVDFWLEVQKFKDLCHAHANDSLVRRKTQAITDCFLNSAIAPELQIDITIEMAEKLLERLMGKHTSLHPYIFREAQMTVFRVLFNLWKEFVTYRSKAPAGESLLHHLDEQLKKQKADAKAKREASERRRIARLSAERRKKDKEERERKRMEDLSSLFSLEAASVFYSEEDDVNSWHYSKHVVEQERQEHIRRLREQGVIVPDDAFLDTEKEGVKSRRSRISVTKSPHLEGKTDVKPKNKSLSVVDGSSDKKSSERSSGSVRAKLLDDLKKQNAGQVPQSPLVDRRSSFRSQSPAMLSARRNSILSQKSTRFSRTGKDGKKPGEAKDPTKGPAEAEKIDKPDSPQDESKKAEKPKPPCKAKLTKEEINKATMAEIQVIPLAGTEEGCTNNSARGLLLEDNSKAKRGKLLTNRAQQNKRLLKGEKKRVPLDAISCISDYSTISNVDLLQSRQDISPHKIYKTPIASGAATPLTFKSLKDFTDSPEGAPLAVPLPLVRITSASHKDLSDGEESQAGHALDSFKPRPQHVITMTSRLGSARDRRKRLGTRQAEPAPDVVVN